ncbi:MAG: hypothetical protein SFX72_07415 [Isosphaeraceae bacterium]|nr:hypothetical protein [Isosphaeraceae bacterium]
MMFLGWIAVAFTDGPRKWDVPGVVFTATHQDSFVRRAQPCAIELTMKNTTDKTFRIMLAGFWPNHRIILRDQAGQPPDLTEHGRLCVSVFSPGGPRDKNAPHDILPGKTYTYKTPDLAKVYQLRPGRYTVEVVYEEIVEGKRDRISSSPFDLTVQD